MMHTPRLSNIKRASVLLVAALLLYVFVFSSGYQKYQIEGIIKRSQPEKVWEYVADFNKMRLLNPTILNFKILADHGHAHDWRYTVQYTERLSHWPYWLNTATAKYVVTKSMPGVSPVAYAIKSTHQTCFFAGFYCLQSISEFTFRNSNGDTLAQENIQYQCPPLLGGMCRRELEFQRQAVMHNLTIIFGKQRG
ncbi:uncharacterized protein LOC6605216 [Drosophila sechellia]|uniref:GM24781 n=1 Tax=Drosophila sechellia TaxID=7238 RepID=B4HDV0_DROSE|nr:uncharacterized protein LOC6605216 [Drosophila sechellia]EDW41040.1 GM24781 [Drosophila sechellia]